MCSSQIKPCLASHSELSTWPHRERVGDGDLAQALQAAQHVLVRRLQQLLHQVWRHVHAACAQLWPSVKARCGLMAGTWWRRTYCTSIADTFNSMIRAAEQSAET